MSTPPPAAAEVLPDAAPANWVDRHAPYALRPWLKLGRFDRPVGVWLLMLPGWQGIALAAAQAKQLPSPYLLAAFLVGAALMRAAGCAYNDIVDRDIDARVARTAARPVASGRISVRAALLFTVVCCLVSLLVLLTLGRTAIALGVASLLLVAAYPFMKRITWWPQAWLGLTFNWGALMGYAAAGGQHWTSAVLLYAGGIAWTLGYDTLYAVQDLEDDALAGVKSSARRLGDAVRPAVGLFYLMAMLAALGAAGWLWLPGALRLGLLSLPLIACYALHLRWQARRAGTRDPAEALRLFKSNRDAGLLLFAALALGAWL